MPAKPREHHAHASRTGAPHTHPPRVPPVSLSTAAPTGEIPPALVLWRGGCASATRSASEVQQRPTPHQPTEGSEHEMSTRESWRAYTPASPSVAGKAQRGHANGFSQPRWCLWLAEKAQMSQSRIVGLAAALEPAASPVSYTHLTLPTILLV